MKISVTFRELLDKGVYDRYCKDKGLNPWMINEGLADSEESVLLTKEEAEKYGFMPIKKDGF